MVRASRVNAGHWPDLREAPCPPDVLDRRYMTLTHCCCRSFAHSHVFCAPGRRGDAFVQSWRASVGLQGAGGPYTGMVAGAVACADAALGAHRVGWLWRSRGLDRGMRRCFRKSNVLFGCICFRPIRTGGWAKACGFRWCSGFAYFALYFARTQSLRVVDLIVAAAFCGQPGVSLGVSSSWRTWRTGVRLRRSNRR